MLNRLHLVHVFVRPARLASFRSLPSRPPPCLSASQVLNPLHSNTFHTTRANMGGKPDSQVIDEFNGAFLPHSPSSLRLP